mgnify:CR=1 FL=1|jgi:hypothetical protein
MLVIDLWQEDHVRIAPVRRARSIHGASEPGFVFRA